MVYQRLPIWFTPFEEGHGSVNEVAGILGVVQTTLPRLFQFLALRDFYPIAFLPHERFPWVLLVFALTYALRKKEDSESPEVLAKTFRQMYQNNPAVRAYVDKNIRK